MPDVTRAAPASGTVRPASRIRRVVARKMTESWQTVPAVTLQRAVAFDALLDRRANLADDGCKPAIDTLLAHLSATALADHELLNGSWVVEEEGVRIYPYRHVAVAVDTPDGVSAVVLRDADTRPVAELDQDLRSLVERARSGRSRPEDVLGATFTLTNLGSLGIDAFNPIVPPPQVAILGIGRIVAHDGKRVANLCLTFDHRAVDGADAARFLERLAGLLENPPIQG